jgi:hypothetical protein
VSGALCLAAKAAKAAKASTARQRRAEAGPPLIRLRPTRQRHSYERTNMGALSLDTAVIRGLRSSHRVDQTPTFRESRV